MTKVRVLTKRELQAELAKAQGRLEDCRQGYEAEQLDLAKAQEALRRIAFETKGRVDEPTEKLNSRLVRIAGYARTALPDEEGK